MPFLPLSTGTGTAMAWPQRVMSMRVALGAAACCCAQRLGRRWGGICVELNPVIASHIRRRITVFMSVTSKILMDLITFSARQCGGSACIRSMSIRVTDILEMLTAGVSEPHTPKYRNMKARFHTHAVVATFAGRGSVTGVPSSRCPNPRRRVWSRSPQPRHSHSAVFLFAKQQFGESPCGAFFAPPPEGARELWRC